MPLLTLFAAGLLAAPAPHLLATGWDSPTPAEYRQHLAAFERLPFDGTTIRPTRRLADGRTVQCLSAYQREHWTWEEFAPALADLQAARPTTALASYLMLYSNPGDVDWFDDAGWTEIVDHWRLLARLARQGGLAGILFDAEPYEPPHAAYRYGAQAQRAAHSFADYRAKARERGRAVMTAVAGEYPAITLYTYRLLCDLLRLGPGAAAALEVDTYGLLPAFVDGWLDALPPAAIVVEGDENAYRYNSPAEFDRAYVELRTRAAALLAPEHAAKLRAQYRLSHGIYLDAHVNPPTSPWYIDRRGGTSAQRLGENVAASLRASDGYTWIYGETGRWWPSGDAKYPLWSDKLPGAEAALWQARDPLAAARRALATAPPAANRLRNPSLVSALTDWWTWQDETSHGRCEHDPVGAARLSAVDNGCFGQVVDVKPGERYAVAVQARHQGAGWVGATVRWKTAEGHWTAEALDVPLEGDGEPDAGGWQRFLAGVTVPESAGQLVLLLAARGQGADGQAWFKQAQVVGLP